MINKTEQDRRFDILSKSEFLGNSKSINEIIPLISVSVATYNHEKFIGECLEGILMQTTTFEFEIVVGEDCSNDKTRAICIKYAEKYPNKIRLFLRDRNLTIVNNEQGKFLKSLNGLFTAQSCRGKYIAFCEGDDYWTDPYKLQKQVDFLENNPDYSICWTKYWTKNESINSSLEKPDWVSQIEANKDFIIDLNNVFTPYCTLTLTTVLRRETLDLDLFKKLRYSKDNSVYAICLSKGKGMLLDFYSGVYRLHDGGTYSNISQFRQHFSSYFNLKEIVAEIPNCKNDNIKGVRNYLLKESIKYHPDFFSPSFLNLLKDGINFFGLKKSLGLIFDKFKNER